ncbi:MAG: amidohydrolase [Acidobacteriota bacterium]|nr:amidohydrolase [Acidobacteriota bacterium]
MMQDDVARRTGAGAVVTAALFGVALAFPAAVCSQPADLVFRGEHIVTLAPPAEALAVRGEDIVAVGRWQDVAPLVGDDTRVVELGDRALIPGFIDAHGHLVMAAQTVDLANVASPPVGPVETLADLIAELSRFARARELADDDWVVGFGYDDSLIAERRHPTAADLDAAFPDRPDYLVHVSGHLAAVNSRALEIAGVGAETPDPPGGHIRRLADGRRPNGVLEESARGLLERARPVPTGDEMQASLRRAQDLYARNGITTGQDGFTSAAGLALLEAAAARDEIVMDVITFPAGRGFSDERLGELAVGNYRGRLKVGGVKLSLDGSPQGKTAYLTQPYAVPPAGQKPGYRGYPAMEQEQVDALFARFLGQRIPILAHANGDAAADQLLHAMEAVERDGDLGDHRTVMIHSQIVRRDQLERIARLRVVPSFFVAHTFFWGDWHRDSVLGHDRAYFISPARTASEFGIRYTFHNDAPIVPPDMLRLIWTGVNRRTRSGDILGPAERVSTEMALRAVTIEAAYQNFEEDQKGTLEVGKQADLVVLSADPLFTPAPLLKDIAVVETISRGRSIYLRDGS